MKLFNFNIICDRYIVDTEIDFKLNFPQENTNNWILWKVLKILALKPNFTFLLLISPEESKRRSISKKEPFPDKLNTLKKRFKYYKNLVNNYPNIKMINSEKSINFIKNYISETVKIKF